MPIWNPTNRWRSTLVAVAAAGALGACSKSEHDKVSRDHGHASGSGDAARSSAPAKPHGGHEPAHGGLVMMDAAYHVEIVLDTKAGKHRVYVSDGAREPLLASTFDEMKLTVAGEELALARAADDTFWEGTGKPAPTAGAKVSIAYSKGGKQVARFDDLPVEYVLTGKMPDAAPLAAGEHAHKTPHGGLVKTTSGGHIELVVERSGAFQVWLLDANLTPRTVDGASVKIEVAAKGYPEVVAAAKGDHFEGKGPAIPGGHPAATVTAAVGGKTETARFELHLESGGAGKSGH